MTIKLTSKSFKDALTLLRKYLDEYDVSLSLKNIRNLLSITLVNKNWSQLSPALPVDITRSYDLGMRMEDWLIQHHKPLGYDLCDLIFDDIVDVIENNVNYLERDIAEYELASNPGWEYMDNLNQLKNKTAPLYNGTAVDMGYVYPATILINSYSQYIETLPHTYRDVTDSDYDYEIEIPGDITGQALVDILKHDKFTALTQAILNNTGAIEFNEKRAVENIGDKNKVMLDEFIQWIETQEFDRDNVCDAEDYYLCDVSAYDKEENDILDVYEPSDIMTKVVIDWTYIITAETNISQLATQIRKDTENDTELLELEPYLKSWHDIVSENSACEQQAG